MGNEWESCSLNRSTLCLNLNPPGNNCEYDSDEDGTSDQARTENDIFRVLNCSMSDIRIRERFYMAFMERKEVSSEDTK